MAANNAINYSIKVIQASDSATAFGAPEIYDINGGTLLDTLSNPATGSGDLAGATEVSIPLSSDTLFIRGAGKSGSTRSTIAGIIISANSIPEMDITLGAAPSSGTDLTLSWSGVNGTVYGVQTNADLVDGTWNSYTNILGDGGSLSFTNNLDETAMYFRIIVE